MKKTKLITSLTVASALVMGSVVPAFAYSKEETVYTKLKTNGTENIAYLSELDSIEWIYGKIYLNDANLDPCDNDLRSTIILHEMCHVYGGKDVYDNANTIMYGRTPTVRGLTSDFNSVLVNKYNY